MSITIGFQGLCAMVSEKRDVATSATFDALLVDWVAAKLTCPHEPKLDLPFAGVDDPDGLTKVDPTGSRRTLDLTGKKITFLPNGIFSSKRGIFGTANLKLIPEMKLICNIGTVDSGCFALPPTKPVTARVELPGEGTISGNPNNPVGGEWSFVPPISPPDCYHGAFTKEVLFDLPDVDFFVIEVETLSGAKLGKLTLRTTLARLTVSNVCETPALDKISDDTLVYFMLLNPPLPGTPPTPRPNGTCSDTPDVLSPGIGCAPFLMSRT